METIDRYMHAVAQALPECRRDEITRELRANILDSLESIREQQEREPTEGEVVAVLVTLGHPQQVAASFLPPQQLVTADLFPLYRQSLHYGAILVFILGLIQFAISFLNSGNMDFIDLFHGLVMKGLITFAVITGLFYVFSNPPGGKPLFNPYQCWSPEKLPPVSRPWQRISSAEQGVDFASDLFFLLLLNYSFWMPSEQVSRLAVIFADPVREWIPLLSGVMIVSLLFGLWNMVYQYWTIPKLVIEALINLGVAVILLKVSRLEQILVHTHNPLVEPVEMLELANHIFGVGVFWVGMWLMFIAGWNLYRIWQLSRT
ncbi:hypothetical protein [Cellvibrio sp.]|jgi:hypothetical protein